MKAKGCIIMKDLMKEINALFDLCEDANLILKSIDAYTQHKLIEKIQMQSAEVFRDLENVVNPMGKKDMIKEITDRKTILRLYYILLRSLYTYSINGYAKFESDRSYGSTMLAYRVIKEQDFLNKFGQSQTWINNETIYDKVFLPTVRHINPTNMQSLIRCFSATLLYPEVREQKVTDYMAKFESCIFYYLTQSPSEERIYLDYL